MKDASPQDAGAHQAETVRAVADDQEQITSALSVALCISLDSPLQNRLRALTGAADAERFLVGQMRANAWLEVSNGAVVKIHRKRIDGLPWVDFDQAGAGNSDLATALRRIATRTSAMRDARSLIEPILDEQTLPSRDQFKRLRQWSPLLERLAYRCATRIVDLLDSLRPHVRGAEARSAHAGSMTPHGAYWTGVHIMANLIFLASEAEAQPWLSEMADQFPWTIWTPTYPLLRERTVWLAACAARSAIAFGEPVVDKYLRMLSSVNRPMQAFDALFGLAAIALANPKSADAIVAEIRSLRSQLDDRDVPHLEYFEQSFDDALRTITAGKGELFNADSRSLGWRSKSKLGLATPAALRKDPATITSSRRLLGFAALPTIVATSPEDYHPASKAQRNFQIADSEKAEIIKRAWGPGHPSIIAGFLS